MVLKSNIAHLFVITVILTMAEQNAIIKELQSKVISLERDLAGLRYNFNEEKNNNIQLRERLEKLRNDKVELIARKNDFQHRIDMLQTEICQLTQMRKKFKPIKVNKIWHDLDCKRTKYKRKAKYKDVLDESLKCITECKRAKVTLTLGKEDVDINWTDQEMNQHRAHFGITLPATAHPSPDLQTPDSNEGNSGESNRNKTNEYDVFDAQCNITEKHKRTIITAMDRHRISHKAYHAIRKAGKHNWPSLNMIKKEKKKMSKEIPFTTDNEVI